MVDPSGARTIPRGVHTLRRSVPGPQPKSNRTSPPSSFNRASNVLPVFEANPLSFGLRPCFNSACADFTEIFLPAMVFHTTNLQPDFHPLHPNDFGPSTTSAPHTGHF